MSGYGFGPQSARATTARPPAPVDAYGQQTYFANATAAGATDGTVIPAEWLNMVIGQLLYLCNQAGVVPSPDLNADAQLYNAVRAIAALYGAVKVSPPLTVGTGGTIGLDLTALSHAQTEQTVADIIGDPTAMATLATALSTSLATPVVNDLTTGGATSALSAQQGVVLRSLIAAASAPYGTGSLL